MGMGWRAGGLAGGKTGGGEEGKGKACRPVYKGKEGDVWGTLGKTEVWFEMYVCMVRRKEGGMGVCSGLEKKRNMWKKGGRE